VTGGFHTDHVLAAARRQGMTCLTVRPRLSQQDLVNPYFALIRERRTPLEKLLAENQNILALAPGYPQVGEADRTAILTPEQEAAQPEGIRLFLTTLRLALQQEQAAQSAAEGAAQIPVLAAAHQEALSQYPYAAGVEIDWARAQASGRTVILPFKNLGLSAVIQPANAVTQTGGVELARVELPEAPYVIRMLDNETVAQVQEQCWLRAGPSPRKAGRARGALQMISRWRS
jgi:hypothetical protein